VPGFQQTYIYIYIHISFSRHYVPSKIKAFRLVLPEENFGGHWQCDDEFWLHVCESSDSESAVYTQEYFSRICRHAVLKTESSMLLQYASSHPQSCTLSPSKIPYHNSIHNFPTLVTAARAKRFRNFGATAILLTGHRTLLFRNVGATAILLTGHRTLLFTGEGRDNRNGIISIALSSQILNP